MLWVQFGCGCHRLPDASRAMAPRRLGKALFGAVSGCEQDLVIGLVTQKALFNLIREPCRAVPG
jgi:hypothetical protein